MIANAGLHFLPKLSIGDGKKAVAGRLGQFGGGKDKIDGLSVGSGYGFDGLGVMGEVVGKPVIDFIFDGNDVRASFQYKVNALVLGSGVFSFDGDLVQFYRLSLVWCEVEEGFQHQSSHFVFSIGIEVKGEEIATDIFVVGVACYLHKCLFLEGLGNSFKKLKKMSERLNLGRHW